MHRPKCDLAYKLYEKTCLVPGQIWKNRDYIIEKFLPEREGDSYILRNAYFFNEVSECWKLFAPDPIVRWRNLTHEELCLLPPAVEEYRRLIKLDYGKIDFVMHGDVPFIFDVNKTIGGPAVPEWPMSQRMAAGLLSSFRPGRL